jgi:dGTPase
LVEDEGGGQQIAAYKEFVYDDDVELITKLLEGTRVDLLDTKDRDRPPPRTLVCAIMDWADDIAYSVHDLEDGIFSGFLVPETFMSASRADTVFHAMMSANIDWGDQDPPTVGDVGNVLQELARGPANAPEDPGALRETTRRYIDRFVLNTEVTVRDLADGSYGFELKIPPSDRVAAEALKALTR